MKAHIAHDSYRHLFVGLDAPAPVYNGSPRPYINLDNAASTPPFQAVQEAVDHFLPYYSSVHRGTGFKSQLSTHLYETARETVMRFVQADPAAHVCIFGKNTTEAINKLARRFPFTANKNIVLVSAMEHHSNDLPWRAAAHTIHLALTPEGRLDEGDLDRKLAEYQSRIALIAITGASNVTGFINPIHRLAEKAHAAGAHILIDCAQLAPHRKIDMRSLDDPSHLDYVILSAHKMYAPFGTGALIGRKDTFETGNPDMTGGGTVEIVTVDSVEWADPPDREEAGSPNTIGAIALAAAIKQLEAVGMDNVAAHEADLTRHMLERLRRIPGIRIYGDNDPNHAPSRLGVIPLALQGTSHFKVAAILGHEFAIGVRSGCFCAHPYILHLLGLTPQEAMQVRERMLTGDRSDMPGLVRASFGLYNNFAEIDAFIEALDAIAAGKYRGSYIQDQASGEYYLEDWSPGFENYFTFPIH